MKTKTGRIISILLALAVMLGLFAAMPLTAHAADLGTSIGNSYSVSALETAIQNSLNALNSGDTFTISGSKTNVDKTMKLTIPSGIKLIWKADYSGVSTDSSTDGWYLLMLSGGGTFEMVEGSIIHASTEGSHSRLLCAGDATTINVKGGSLKAYNCAIWTNAPVNVSGGTISVENGTANGAILATGSNASVKVSGGTVEAAGDSNAIVGNASSSVTVSGGTVSSESGRAINNAGSITVSGGTVSSKTGYALSSTSSGAITVNGGFVFSYGTSITGSDNASVIRSTSGGTISIGGTAVVCAWDKPSGTPTYVAGKSTDLTVNSGGSAKWGSSGPQNGIHYANGANTGFFQISGVKPNPPIRLAGDDRYQTAIEISKKGWTSAVNVVLTSGKNFPDALAGGPLAHMLSAPILLTGGTAAALEPAVLSRISQLGATCVYILGGESAISAGIFNQLQTAGYTVQRIYGADRYETSVAIAKKMDEIRGSAPEFVFVADGTNYPDALAATPVAALKKVPILFTPKDRDGLRAASAEYAKNCGANKAVIVGGTGVVKPDVVTALTGLGFTSERVSGADRYETSAEIYKKYTSVFEGNKAVMATGLNFPDALAGGPLGAKLKAPLLLVNGTGATSAPVKAVIAGMPLQELYILGGTSVVTDAVVNNHLG